MKKKRIISIILTIVLLISSLPIYSIAKDNRTELFMYGGSNEESSGLMINQNGNSGEADFSSFGDNPIDVANNLLKFFNKDNPDGLIIDTESETGTITTMSVGLGDVSATDVLLFCLTFFTNDNREMQDITFQQNGGSTKLDTATLERAWKEIIPQSLDYMNVPSEILEVADTLKQAKMIVQLEIIPFDELDLSTLNPEQLAALNNALSSGATIKFFVKTRIFMDNNGVLIEIFESPGIITNEIADVYAQRFMVLDSELQDPENIYVLHITENGDKVTNIADVKRSYSNLVFRSHLIGDFFIVDSPDSAPTAQPESDPPPQLPNLYSAKLDTQNLTGATATLSKTKDIVNSDIVTLTIKPDIGKKFTAPPVVQAKFLNIGEVTAQADGSYTCEISNFQTNETIIVSGEAVADIDNAISYIALTNPPTKLKYKIGEKLDTSGIVIEAFYADGTSAGIIDNSLIEFSDLDSNHIGKKEITVTYGEYATQFNVRVYFTLCSWFRNLIKNIQNSLC